ncbi:hypothetical protein CIG75_12820 [Tumebacillus algifaecis]|uniref:Uncharacterized protein n=1 Tax=Tumebacillus algifaecis TaxID=1214604 RepID=A0A223D2F1_9BACL|nr:hypothetical protein [Tumebacillus algifaecis]ASS75782.1 hypothetical protein CIG75_12820 [Tumebacillus algifaecis]
MQYNSNDLNKESQLLKHQAEVLSGIIDSKEQYRKLTKAAIARWIKDFQDGRIEINTVDDLTKLIKLDLELQAEDF